MRTKAAYLAFESDPVFEFEYRLALKLGMTVEALRDNMDNDEFIRWAVYFGREQQRRELAMKGK